MAALLAVHDFRLAAGGPSLTFSLKPGQVLAVYGRSGAGKTRFLRSLCGLERGYKGSVRLGGEAVLAGFPEPSRRMTPETLARRAAGRGGATRAAEALSAANLWEARRASFGSLTPGQRAGAELMGVLASTSRLLLIDSQLDLLDLRTRAAAVELLGKRLGEGACAVLATSLPEFAPRADLLAVWRAGSLSFAGTYAELSRGHKPVTLEVETLNDAGARALCDPFEVSVTKEKGGLKLTAKEGQALASRLLLEGFGDVKAVVTRPPTPEELLAEVL